jgi:hypothetical protein
LVRYSYSRDIVGVFSTREKALEAISDLEKRNKCHYHETDFLIDEIKLDFNYCFKY